ncbi:hypothetical protein [Peribacillus sp. TH14]|nr:hypothetical protein [Peribacillus sp. TH14]MBK5500935.1 hypothetical protein [Peribacillus sp. TH14]
MSSEKHANLNLHMRFDRWRLEFNDNFRKIDEKMTEVTGQLAETVT